MKRMLFSLAILSVAACLSAQTTMPDFSKLGYKKPVMYASKMGGFEEFHDQADVVEIGTVLFNTKTNQVVGFLSEEEVDADVSSATTAMSIDPHCERYPWITPYAYCLNNPVNAVDPDGRDIIFITTSGRYQYTLQGTLRHTETGAIVDPSKTTIGGNLGRIIDGYNKMLNSGDENYVKQITTLVNSENIHEINATVVTGDISSVGLGAGIIDKKIVTTKDSEEKAKKGEGIGTYTEYGDLKDGKLSSGLEKTNYTTVAHEVQHQYDYDQGNMKDSYDKNGKPLKGQKDPAEQRAIKNEDTARDQQKLKRRLEY